MDIGKPERVIIVEPLESPMPEPSVPASEPAVEPEPVESDPAYAPAEPESQTQP